MMTKMEFLQNYKKASPETREAVNRILLNPEHTEIMNAIQGFKNGTSTLNETVSIINGLDL